MITFDKLLPVCVVIGVISVVPMMNIVYADLGLGYDYLIRNIINWKNEGKITNDSMNKALDWIIENSNNNEETSKLVIRYKSIGKYQTLLLPKFNEAKDSEHNLLVAYQLVSIPSEELLSICTHKHVLDRSYETLRYECDNGMDIMISEYCPYDTKYAVTLCRDKRVDQFYGIIPNTENIPSEDKISKKGEKVVIGNLSFELTNFIIIKYGGIFNAQIYLTIENLADETTYVSVEDFKIIDEKGNKIDASDLLNDESSAIIEKLNSHEKISAVLFGHSTWRENNILQIDYEGDTRFITIK